MKKSVAILSILFGFSSGVIVGFLLSPVRNGIEIGNDSGNTTNNNYGKTEEETEE